MYSSEYNKQFVDKPEDYYLRNLSVPFNLLKVGDSLDKDGDDKICYIDIQNSIIICEEDLMGDYYGFYYILNPNSKPSLYKYDNISSKFENLIF